MKPDNLLKLNYNLADKNENKNIPAFTVALIYV